jgi:hypothetical protein
LCALASSLGITHLGLFVELNRELQEPRRDLYTIFQALVVIHLKKEETCVECIVTITHRNATLILSNDEGIQVEKVKVLQMHAHGKQDEKRM